MSDNYEKICKDRFTKLEQNQDRIETDVKAVRERVFNGLSDSMKRVEEELKSLRLWVLGLIGTVALSIVATMVKLIWFS
jgi:hypothetical protein